MDAAGDWVAMNGCVTHDAGADCRVIVIQRSTKRVYLLKPPNGVVWALLAVAPSEILLAENDAADVDSALWISRITRIAAAQFGQWDAPL